MFEFFTEMWTSEPDRFNVHPNHLIPGPNGYRWYDRYQTGGPEALADRSPRPSRVWNRIPELVREMVKDLAQF